MNSKRDSVFEEPAFQSIQDKCGSTPEEVWEEPSQNGNPVPSSMPTYRQTMANRWATYSAGRKYLVFLGLLSVSGLVGIGCGFLEITVHSIFISVLFAPLLEELGKILAPMTVLERAPYRFSSGSSVMTVVLVSALVFASVENILYLSLYIKDPSMQVVIWRWTICTLMHITCSAIAGIGLMRMWRQAATAKGPGNFKIAASLLIAAIVIHGVYNTLAIFLSPLLK